VRWRRCTISEMDLCAKSSIKGGLAIIQQHTIRARSNNFSTTSAKRHCLTQPIRAGQEYGCRHCNFELGKVEIESIRKRMVACLLGSIGVDQKAPKGRKLNRISVGSAPLRVVRRGLRSRRRTKRRDLDM